MYTFKLKANFFDCDPAGILFFANVFKYAHQAYEDMLLNNEIERNYFFHEDYSIPILHSEADYLSPILSNTELTISIVVKTLKENSFELNYYFQDDQGIHCALVKTVHILIDKSTWKKTLIPDDLTSLLKKHLEEIVNG